MPRFDLQSHSTHSDGELPAADVVAAAAKAGVELLALSDHDTVGGVTEAVEAGERLGVRVVPAVEISAIDNDGAIPRELHILGYAIEHEGRALTKSLEEFLSDRETRTLRMAAKLREVGWELDQAELNERLSAGRPIGRPHLANAVLSVRANAARLNAEGIDDVGSLIRGYLIEGKPAFTLRETPTIEEAVDAIHDAEGVAIWAHPFWDIAEDDEVLDAIDRFRGIGMDGVEAFYVTHTREQTDLLAARCAELAILTTGSADFHGPDHKTFAKFMDFETYGHEPNLGPLAA